MDPLSVVLTDQRLESTLYSALQVTAPWALEYPDVEHAGFHMVTEGQCELAFGDRLRSH